MAFIIDLWSCVRHLDRCFSWKISVVAVEIRETNLRSPGGDREEFVRGLQKPNANVFISKKPADTHSYIAQLRTTASKHCYFSYLNYSASTIVFKVSQSLLLTLKDLGCRPSVYDEDKVLEAALWPRRCA